MNSFFFARADFLGTFWFCTTYILYNTFRFDGYHAALDLISTIRVARMFKLCNFHPRLKVIITSVSHSSGVLSLLLFFFFLAVMIAGSSVYYVERLSNPSNNQMISIIDGLWFATSTISTLGLGDVVPRSVVGLLFGAITTIAGVLIIDLPMPIIVETFANFNSHLQARQQLPRQRRRITPAIIPRKIKPQLPPNGYTTSTAAAHLWRMWKETVVFSWCVFIDFVFFSPHFLITLLMFGKVWHRKQNPSSLIVQLILPWTTIEDDELHVRIREEWEHRRHV